MDILAVAQNMELEGKAYYERLARETPVSQLKGIFTFLATEEQRHFGLFKALEDQEGGAEPSDDNELRTVVTAAFERFTAAFSLPETHYDYEAVYRKALEMERQSIEFYTSMIPQCGAGQKATLAFIIGQEKTHAKLMESLMEFVANPAGWLENAEWRHPDAY